MDIKLKFTLQVVVTDVTHPNWKYFFPCGQWLAKDEGDGAISRDLVGSKDPLAMRKREFGCRQCITTSVKQLLLYNRLV